MYSVHTPTNIFANKAAIYQAQLINFDFFFPAPKSPTHKDFVVLRESKIVKISHMGTFT
jgi:hypothetical protein